VRGQARCGCVRGCGRVRGALLQRQRAPFL